MPSTDPGSRRPLIFWVLGAVALIVPGILGGVIATAINGSQSALTSASCSVPTVADENLSSIVTIMVASGSASGVGSGEVISSDGYILTNNHVVFPAASGGSVEVAFNDGSTAPATIRGRDPLTDLAVIKVSGRSGLRPIPVGDSSALRIGQPVVALGAPLGLSSTVTSGIVSALGRTVQVPGEGSQSALLVDAVQTDAAINPGNSGGALVDCDGNLIGVPTAGATIPSQSGEASGGSIGLGFAIPSQLATDVASEIIATGRVTHSRLGLQARPLPSTTTSSSSEPSRLFITSVDPGGPADSSGLRANDIITSIDGKPARSMDQLVAITLTRRAGDRVVMGVERQGKHTSITVVLGTQQ